MASLDRAPPRLHLPEPYYCTSDGEVWRKLLDGQSQRVPWAGIFCPDPEPNFLFFWSMAKLFTRWKTTADTSRRPLALAKLIQHHDRNVCRPGHGEYPSGWWFAVNNVVVIFSAS